MRQLLIREMASVLTVFDYFQKEETKEKYIDIYDSYVKCLCSCDA